MNITFVLTHNSSVIDHKWWKKKAIDLCKGDKQTLTIDHFKIMTTIIMGKVVAVEWQIFYLKKKKKASIGFDLFHHSTLGVVY